MRFYLEICEDQQSHEDAWCSGGSAPGLRREPSRWQGLRTPRAVSVLWAGETPGRASVLLGMEAGQRSVVCLPHSAHSVRELRGSRASLTARKSHPTLSILPCSYRDGVLIREDRGLKSFEGWVSGINLTSEASLCPGSAPHPPPTFLPDSHRPALVGPSETI